eukprot:TRINITY_DN4719_c0_g1_i2.p1 TRINITY_DN4719_c0_g1~~TRINITY_DN4719_c0_g1_i2.p1  ORF type:complete len:659 (-),score=136.80 TRINITY_DN4719_c0_g1_i2:417-2225(-)
MRHRRTSSSTQALAELAEQPPLTLPAAVAGGGGGASPTLQREAKRTPSDAMLYACTLPEAFTTEDDKHAKRRLHLHIPRDAPAPEIQQPPHPPTPADDSAPQAAQASVLDDTKWRVAPLVADWYAYPCFRAVVLEYFPRLADYLTLCHIATTFYDSPPSPDMAFELYAALASEELLPTLLRLGADTGNPTVLVKQFYMIHDLALDKLSAYVYPVFKDLYPNFFLTPPTARSKPLAMSANSWLRSGVKAVLRPTNSESRISRPKVPTREPSTSSLGGSSAFGVQRGRCGADAACNCAAYCGPPTGGPCQCCGHFPAAHEAVTASAPKPSVIVTRPPTAVGAGIPPTASSQRATLTAQQSRHKQPSAIAAALAAQMESEKRVDSNQQESKETEQSKEEAEKEQQSNTNRWLLDWNEVTMLDSEPFATGGFAKVYRGTWRNQLVAIKVLREMEKMAIEDFKTEFQLLGSLRSPYIVYFFGAAVTKTHICLLSEYCTRGSLYKVLKSEPRFTWTMALQFTIDTVRGLQCLHSWRPQVLHRDLKSHNILVADNGCAKLCDFGKSRYNNAVNEATLHKVRNAAHFRICATSTSLRPVLGSRHVCVLLP